MRTFMKGLDRLKVIRQLSEKNDTWVHQDIFRILKNEDLWTFAYENLKKKKEISKICMFDEKTQIRLQALKEEVFQETYDFMPLQKRISKQSNDIKIWDLRTINDTIVEEVLRLILAAIYEPIFNQKNDRFYRSKSFHAALKYVGANFRSLDFIIERDAPGADFDINHHRLMKFIKKRISDSRFINLLWKALKGRLFHPSEQVSYSFFSILNRQRSILSPMLLEIYFYEFDVWIHQKMTKMSAKKLPECQRKDLKKQTRMNMTTQTEKDSELVYVRYADHWIIGVCGNENFAKQMKSDVTEFLMTNLEMQKIKIINLRKGKATFLEYELFLPAKSSYLPIFKCQQNSFLRLDIPVHQILEKMIKRGYISRTKKGLRPISKSSYSTRADHVIVRHFRSVYFDIFHYYSLCTDFSRLQYIYNLLRLSCAMTLAHRHRTSSTKIFMKHGKTLTVDIPGHPNDQKKTVSFDSLSWRFETSVKSDKKSINGE